MSHYQMTSSNYENNTRPRKKMYSRKWNPLTKHLEKKDVYCADCVVFGCYFDSIKYQTKIKVTSQDAFG